MSGPSYSATTKAELQALACGVRAELKDARAKVQELEARLAAFRTVLATIEKGSAVAQPAPSGAPHKRGPKPPESSNRARAYSYIRDAGIPVHVRDASAKLDIDRYSLTGTLTRLVAEKVLIRTAPGTYGLPGTTPKAYVPGIPIKSTSLARRVVLYMAEQPSAVSIAQLTDAFLGREGLSERPRWQLRQNIRSAISQLHKAGAIQTALLGSGCWSLSERALDELTDPSRSKRESADGSEP